jgi:hypothetical protein
MKSHPVQWLPSSEDLMDEFLCASAHMNGRRSLREEWFAREALQSIMRLVRSEQLLEIRRSVNRLVPASFVSLSVKRARSRRNQRRQPGQTQLAFGRED